MRVNRLAQKYLEKLSQLCQALEIETETALPLEVKHFFSGAALYVDGCLCASWSPVGLAFKLSQQEVERLIAGGQAKPLKYFPKGHVKKGYALFENPERKKSNHWRKYLVKAVQQVGEA